MKLQPLVLATAFATVIVCLHNWIEFIEWFSLVAVTLYGFKWSWKAAIELDAPEISPNLVEKLNDYFVPLIQENILAYEEQTTEIQPQVEQVEGMATEELIGTDKGVLGLPDPWKTDAVVEPMPEPNALGQTSPQDDKLEVMIQQLSSLPQGKGKRKTWGVLCQQLQLNGSGATKLRDASSTKKAKFLIDKGVNPLQVVKAKVIALSIAA